MKRKIVSDSSANMYIFEGADYTSVDMIISTDTKEYHDNENLDVAQMVEELSVYKGRSGTACPGVGDWLEAFADADEVFCTTISGELSGSYNSALAAKEQYEETHPGRKVYVLDSRATGPTMKLLIEKFKELISADKDYDTICREIEDYKKHTCIIFSLESVRNLANNGRINHAVAAIASMFGIRIVGDAPDGTLNPTDKVRGEKKAIACIYKNMKKSGYHGGKVLIDHCFNEGAAQTLKQIITNEYADAEVILANTTGLCSFYAEKGGLIIGFER